MEEVIKIFDTTLRDGEQSPGASLTPEGKIEIAKALEKLNVDIMEAGFPVSSAGEFEAVKKISEIIKKPVICALARAIEKDIQVCADALKPAKRKRIHTFIATSDIHMKYKLKMTEEEVLERAKSAVKFARKFTDDVEFSPEDATRSRLDFLCRVIEEVIKCGATTINIPDTVGYAVPHEFGKLISDILNKVPNIEKVTISAHCHNDLGLATANSIAAIINGARQVECTINGIGERAGNASLEEIVMTLYARKKLLNFTTNIITREIYKTSRIVSTVMGIPIQPNKAIVGANAFTHASGIHQHGIIMKKLTYEHINPKVVGVPTSKLVLSKHSGRHALEKKLKELGYKLTQDELDKVFKLFKDLSDRKKYIFDRDLVSLVEEIQAQLSEKYELDYFHISTGTNLVPTATVRLKLKTKKGVILLQQAGCGDGPVDAAYNAIDKIIGFKPRLLDYSLRSISSGKDAMGEVQIMIEYKRKKYFGKGTSTDIIEASLKSYLSAINKIQNAI